MVENGMRSVITDRVVETCNKKELQNFKPLSVKMRFTKELHFTQACKILNPTLHNGASNEIKEIKVFQKCPKVKPYCTPIFDPILFKLFLDDAKLPKFCAKYFSLSKRSNIGCIFLICL